MSGAAYRKDLLSPVFVEGTEPTFPILLHETRPSIWKEKGSSDEDIAGFLFNEDDNTYSFWKAGSKADVLLAAHFMSSGRREPFARSVHFVSVQPEFLDQLVPYCEQCDEHEKPACIGILGHHFNCEVTEEVASKIVHQMRESLLAIPKRSLLETHEKLRAAECRHFGPAMLCACLRSDEAETTAAAPAATHE